MFNLFASAASSLLSATADVFNSVKNGSLEREDAKTLTSALYSGAVSFFWNLQFSRPAAWLGLQPACRDGAVAMFRVLDQRIQDAGPGMLTLAVPKEMLDADLQARFQVEEKSK